MGKKKGGWQAMNIEVSPAVEATETRDELKRNHEDDALNADAGAGCGEVEDFAPAEEHEEEGWCLPNGTAEDKKADQGYLRCDLCNEFLSEDEDMHQQRYHAELINWCSKVLSVDAKEMCTSPVTLGQIGDLGLFVIESVAELDMGREAFAVIQRASEQLREIIGRFMRNAEVFLFGGCVACGSWDGVGDADFTVLESIHSWRLKEGEWENPDEKRCIFKIAAALRNAGFLHSELEPVVRTRVPVLKRKQKVRAPLRVPMRHDGFKLVYEFSEPPPRHVHDAFLRKARDRKIKVEETYPNKVTLHFDTAHNALQYYLAREWGLGNVTKRWKSDHQLPDIFFLDFDISCRPLGVRNSWFMRQYFSQHPVARAGLAFLKRWSKQCGINNAPRGYLTSYAIMVLWAYYLLRRGLVEYVDPASFSLTPSSAQLEVSYLPLLRDEGNGGESMRSVSHSPTFEPIRGELDSCVAGFFSFYASFSWEEFVVSLRARDGDVTRESLGWVEASEVKAIKLKDRVWYRMCIEDPYEDNLNLGRHLSPKKFAFVRSQFVVAHSLLMCGQPQRLLEDAIELASITLRALLHRIVYEEGLTELSLSEARDFIVSRLDEEKLAYYEVQYSLESLCNMLLQICNSNGKRGQFFNSEDESTHEPTCARAEDGGIDGDAHEGDAGCVDGTERSLSPRSCLHEIDEKMRAACPLGILDGEIPASVRGAYFFACGRAFRTAAERDVLQVHVSALSRVWRDASMGIEEVRVKLEGVLPTAVRDPALIDVLLQYPGVHDMLRVEDRQYGEAKRTVVREKPPPKMSSLVLTVRRAQNSFVGKCSDCMQENVSVWRTNNRRRDPGTYCDACWKVYEGANQT
ncbi:hypothetical protein MOQ_004602 [Trypanosoma cruzi marinkellei]|uniref:RNA uridylyltransferase n=1 Tax=Trypanosoma cruzi marinkellei TaxID=85056 RepID=K2MWX1_TRYCR|nr:hypothetical protein MOQ_004602 [Trypanosoma cruzi marinkellei]